MSGEVEDGDRVAATLPSPEVFARARTLETWFLVFAFGLSWLGPTHFFHDGSDSGPVRRGAIEYLEASLFIAIGVMLSILSHVCLQRSLCVLPPSGVYVTGIERPWRSAFHSALLLALFYFICLRPHRATPPGSGQVPPSVLWVLFLAVAVTATALVMKRVAWHARHDRRDSTARE